MEEQNVVIEITDTEIRLVVGYVKDNKPHIVYMAQRPCAGLISHGEIIDYKSLTEILSSLREIRDDNLKEKMTINEVTVILPALGLNIFETSKSNFVVSNDSIVDYIDIKNIVSMISKEQVPSGTEIIDIIPDSYILDGGVISNTPPIGEKSNEITINAKIHTLPSRIVAEYKRVIESAHLVVSKFCLNSYALCELGKYTEGIPENYILVDMGSEVSDITLVGNNSPYGTFAFQAGGQYIVNKLIEKFGVTPEKALELLTNNGYYTRKLTFEPVVATVEINGETKEFTQNDLNAIIKDYFDSEFFPRFDSAYESLLVDYNENAKKLPIVFTGGFSMMIGFEELAREKFVQNEGQYFLSPKTIGARSAQYAIAVGGLMIACSHKGAYSEQKRKFKISR